MPDLLRHERAIFRVASALCRLPPRVQHLLSRGPIVRDGLTMHPEMAILMRTVIDLGSTLTPGRLRKVNDMLARAVGGPADHVVTRDLQVDGGHGKLRARHYIGERGAPLLVFLHGGGFVFGNLDSHDALCRVLCQEGRMHVLAVDYRLAPEHPFPAALDDALAAFRWAVEHGAELGADPKRVGIGGDSAGGNLSAVLAQVTAREGGPVPALQLLIYPAVDRRSAWPSVATFGKGFYLTQSAIDWFYAQYAPSGRDDPRLHPLASEDLSGLAPAIVVTAGFDPLRDEGEAYGKALAAKGNVVKMRRFDGFPHGFMNMVGVSPAARDAVLEIAASTRALFVGGSA